MGILSGLTESIEHPSGAEPKTGQGAMCTREAMQQLQNDLGVSQIRSTEYRPQIIGPLL